MHRMHFSELCTPGNNGRRCEQIAGRQVKRGMNAAGGVRRQAIGAGIGCAAVLAAGGAYYWYDNAASVSDKGPRATGRPAVPVTVAVAERRDVPIYLTGLGSVQALLSIDIQTRVDGELQQVMFTEGQHVRKGDVLAKIDPRPFQAVLDQAKAKRAQDEAALVAAEKDLTRAKTLSLKSFETQQNVDLQQAKVDQLKASIAADEAAMESAQTQLDYATIVAPSDGRVGIRRVDPGNIVHAADTRPITSLVLMQPCAVLFVLPATNLTDVRQALKRGPVEVTAFDENGRAALSTGQLLLIDNAIDQATANIRLKAIFSNDDDILWAGEFVNARILVDTRRDVLTIPSASIQSGPKGAFTWVVAANNTAEARAIEVGPATDDVTVITAGLAEGDRVVVAGHYKLQSKAPVVASLIQSSPQPRSRK
jgi:membrane fusion protein, multidrug efflux system